MADIVFHNIHTLMAEGAVNLESDTLKCALVSDSYTPDADHTQWSDASANELAGNYGYTTGGETLTNYAVTDDDSNNTTKHDCDDISWTASGGDIGPARYGIIYDDTHASDVLIYCFDFAENKTAGNGTDFKITIDGNGLFTVG